MPRPPTGTPVGLHLDRVARAVSRAFDARLAAAGGSRAVWLVLLTLRPGPVASQRELAEALDVRAATLTQQLDAMEAAGLVARIGDPGNRRVRGVELTAAGLALFDRLREAAVAHDALLREGLSAEEIAQVTAVLERMRRNVAG
ncbi:MarR family winged helix-turn-helix transcriptional regulator [Blastococcus sp. SYSU D00695]